MGWCRDAAQPIRQALDVHDASIAFRVRRLAGRGGPRVSAAISCRSPAFEIVYKSTVAVLGIAGGAVMLALLVRFTGTSAVTNTDIVEFLLSPMGVGIAVAIGLSALLITVIEHSG